MRISAATAIALGLLLLLLGSRSLVAQVAARHCERLVEFRDGSILRLQLPADYAFEFRSAVPALEGDSDEIVLLQLRVESLSAIRFSKRPALRQLRVIQDAVAQLQEDDFVQREQALRTLVSGGDGFRPFLEDLFASVGDPEGRWRLASALEFLPSHPSMYAHAYDEIDSAGQVTKGDVDEWRIAAQYRGTALELDRHRVRSIRLAPDLVERGETPIVANTEPIRQDLDALFPGDRITIDFEFDSRGDALRPGQDLSRRFIPDGLVIDTSIEGSYFSVNDFNVLSRSRGQSGATHLPLFQGTISLRFCVPGNENEPAGVTQLGFYAAAVLEGGTSLAAFDASGHRIATVTTVVGNHQFLGLRSNVPIHRVAIIPNKEIDPDVAIDDLVFSVPEPLDSGGPGSGDGYTLDFRSGERIVCDRFRRSGESVIAQPRGGFGGEIAVPVADLVRLQTQVDDQPLPDLADAGVRFWAMLEDGSTLLVRDGNEEKLPCTEFGGLPLDSLPLAALWSEHGELAPFPAELELHAAQVVTIATSVPAILTEPVLTSKKFTATDADATVEYSYNRLPTIWLKKPDAEVGDRASGFIRLSSSERLLLGSASTFQISGFDSDSVSLTCAGHELRIPLASITSLRLPKSK